MRYLLLTLALWGAAGLSGARIVPEPAEWRREARWLTAPANPGFVLRAPSERLAAAVPLLLGPAWRETGADAWLEIVETPEAAPGAYTLELGDRACLTGDEEGIFYGLQSLRQLLASGRFPAGTVRDAPAIARRGMCFQWCFELPRMAYLSAVIDAMAQLKYNILIPEFGPLLRSERHPERFADPERTYLLRAEFRQLLREAAARRLNVIPLLNSLDHGERSVPWVTRLGGGLDMKDEANYRLLFDIVEEYIEDFAAAGMPLDTFHFGMDEASSVLLANAEKYGESTARLLGDHIARIREFCRSRGIRMVIWHDTLMSSADPLYDQDMNYVHADRAGAWPIRGEVPRDVALMYWNYEARDRYKVADGLQREGFEVWLMPWSGAGVRRMAVQAAEQHMPLVGSTWMEGDFYLDRIPGVNTMARSNWMLASLVEVAEYAWKPVRAAETLDYDPALYWSQLLYPAPVDALTPSGAAPLQLGDRFDGGDNLAQLRLPLTVRYGDAALATISAVNQPRGENQLILYTPAWGASSGANGFGTELAVHDGVVGDRTTWGVGDSAIRAGGFVLSGHGAASAPLDTVTVNTPIAVVDADGRSYGANPAVPGPERATVLEAEHGTASGVELCWATRRAAPLDGAALGSVVFRYADGGERAVEIVYGRELFSGDAPGFFWGGGRVWYRPTAAQVWYGCRIANPEPERAVAALDVTLTPRGMAAGLEIAGGKWL